MRASGPFTLHIEKTPFALFPPQPTFPQTISNNIIKKHKL